MIGNIGLSIGIVKVATPAPDPDPSTSTTCLTPECVALGAQVLASLDETFDPCVDFYKFACNTTLKQAIIPYGELQLAGYPI